MQNQQELTYYLHKNGIIKSKKLFEVFFELDRKDFVLDEQKNLAYLDIPLSIGYGQTISAPHMHALMAYHLDLEEKKNLKILEVGTGSGYLTALIKKISTKSTIFSVEPIMELALFAQKNILKSGLKALLIEKKEDKPEEEQINIFVKNGYFGLEEYSLYDRIIVGACYDQFPNFLIKQLKKNGVLISPIYYEEDGLQHLIKIKKTSKITITDLGLVSFVYIQK
ncbi:MAG: protein-L-isoaspartate O-methyltransferase [Candidatus Anstonellaceae archaeon]